MQAPHERLLRYLDEAHAAEVGIVEMLQDMMQQTQQEQIRAAFEAHMLQTKEQALRVETRLRALGGTPSGGKSFFNSMLSRVADLLHGRQDAYDKTTQDVIKAYSVEHLEIGMYAALATFARLYGDRDTEALALQIMAEEQAAADQLRPLIDSASAKAF